MILRYANLHLYPRVFLATTGLKPAEFDRLFRDVGPLYLATEQTRHAAPARQRAVGAGHPFALDVRDQLLLAVVWLRLYPTHEVLGFLFGVSDSTVSRLVARWLPLLAQAGRDQMRLVDPGRKHRRSLDEVLQQVPEMTAVIDTFEQRVQRPPERPEADRWYSGKKKTHTIKSQVVVQRRSGLFVDVAESVPGPTNDGGLVRSSGVQQRLPRDTLLGGDLAYVGAGKEGPGGPVVTPRRKPRGKECPAADIEYNRTFARVRIAVEHSIGRARHYQAVTQTDRQHRTQHTARVQAVAGLVNRQITTRLPYLLHE